MIKWLKKLFTKEKTFDNFLKELIKERREASMLGVQEILDHIKKMDHHQKHYLY